MKWEQFEQLEVEMGIIERPVEPQAQDFIDTCEER